MQTNIDITGATKNNIAQLAKGINAAYREMKDERMKINTWEWENEFDFTILGIIDLYTSYVCGYASQIATRGKVQNSQEAVNHLQQIQFFDKPYFVQWYFAPDNGYPKVKDYVHKLNYLRLSALEYLNLYQNGSDSNEFC